MAKAGDNRERAVVAAVAEEKETVVARVTKVRGDVRRRMAAAANL
jgi:hypothetical protein